MPQARLILTDAPWHDGPMRGITVVLSLTLLVGSLPLASGAAATERPLIRFAKLAPLQVKGTRFKPRERVRIMVSVDGAGRVKHARASAAGRFAVTFRGVQSVDRCNSDVWARATGRRGSRATAKLPQLQCPPRLSTP